MAEWVSGYEMGIRASAFGAVVLLMAVWEIAAPRRPLVRSKAARWGNNLALVALNGIIVRVLFPAGAVGVAVFAEGRGWGLLGLVALPPWLEGSLAIIALDLVVWTQHVLVHAIPVLWRLHRVHHADPDYDLTTGARFHPLEIVLSMVIKFGSIVLIGPAVVAVILFEVLLNATSMFNHGNVRLPAALDRGLRLVFVTPDMHRVHHSVEDDETNSNFGFNLTWWDFLFGTAHLPDHWPKRYGTVEFQPPEDYLGQLAYPFRRRGRATPNR